MKKVDDLYATAWQDAIRNVATIVNRRLGTALNLKDDWNVLENLAMDLDVRFDADGNVVEKEDVICQ